ncbi:Uu.00g084130.m01.CDS01 [Anthostomella pinea]|uniref:Uu.00g084130.m01.CDS01 n=1 Tax=Anthostomella pinea TaxID=933095 RepID=A0AAI8VMC9_9PEZI|nr:Uu.00g084130.m01.CDS01 [Anthostomella pinea]
MRLAYFIPEEVRNSEYLAYMMWVVQGRRDAEFPPASHKLHVGIACDRKQSCDYLPEELTTAKCCTQCGASSASLRCSRCLITENGHPVIVTSYCNADCQKAHCSSHRKVYKPLQRLNRAVHLARDLFAAAAEVTILDTPTPRILLPWEFAVTSFDRSHFEDHNHAMAVLHDLGEERSFNAAAGLAILNAFITPLCDGIQEIYVLPKNALFGYEKETCSEREVAGQFNMLKHHGLFVASLGSQLKVAIDFAGEQFGWQEPMVSWNHFVQHRCERIIDVADKTGGLSRVVMKEYASDQPLYAALKIRQSVTTAMMNAILTWMKSRNVSLQDLLSKPDDAFDELRTTILSKAKEECNAEVARLRDRGLYRHYGGPRVGKRMTLTKESANRMKKVWLTDDEMKLFDGESAEDRLMYLAWLYENKANKQGVKI